MAKNFAVFRVQSIKRHTDLANATLHGARQDSSTHFDPARTRFNRHWFLGYEVSEPANWSAAVGAIVARSDIKVRKGAAVAAEILISASASFFEGTGAGQWPLIWDKERIDQWVDANLKAFEAKFPGLIAAARLDVDEGTPHLSLCVVPIYLKPVGDRYVPTVSFRRTFGGEKREDVSRNMIAWQDWYAARMAPFGLVRGVPKAITGKVGLTHQAYRRLQQQQDLAREAALANALTAESRALERAAAIEAEAVAKVEAYEARARAAAEKLKAEIAERLAAADAAKIEAARLLTSIQKDKAAITSSLNEASRCNKIALSHMAVLTEFMGEWHPHAAILAEKSNEILRMDSVVDAMLEMAAEADPPNVLVPRRR